MSSPTNVTDRISQLRNKKNISNIIQKDKALANQRNSNSIRIPKISFDYFANFNYFLISISLISQLVLIVILDII